MTEFALYPFDELYPSTSLWPGTADPWGPSGPAPPMTQFAIDAYAYLEPIAAQDEDYGFVLRTMIGAFGEAFREVEEVARSQAGREPYQQTYDIDACPDFMLGWLGQFVGVPWGPYTDAVAKRQQVRAEAGFYRGSIANLLAAVTATQTEPNRVTLLERDPDAWGISLLYDDTWTPSPAVTEAAAIAATAWGLKLTIGPASLPLFEEAGPAMTFEAVGPTVTFESATIHDLI